MNRAVGSNERWSLASAKVSTIVKVTDRLAWPEVVAETGEEIPKAFLLDALLSAL